MPRRPPQAGLFSPGVTIFNAVDTARVTVQSRSQQARLELLGGKFNTDITLVRAGTLDGTWDGTQIRQNDHLGGSRGQPVGVARGRRHASAGGREGI